MLHQRLSMVNLTMVLRWELSPFILMGFRLDYWAFIVTFRQIFLYIMTARLNWGGEGQGMEKRPDRYNQTNQWITNHRHGYTIEVGIVVKKSRILTTLVCLSWVAFAMVWTQANILPWKQNYFWTFLSCLVFKWQKKNVYIFWSHPLTKV